MISLAIADGHRASNATKHNTRIFMIVIVAEFVSEGNNLHTGC